MENLILVNKATAYIESHIEDKISVFNVSNHVKMSHSQFLKVFSMITSFTLTEYIQKRRLTLASYEVMNSNTKLIDIAVKYQYSGNETFSRAFKKFHGVSPRQARKLNTPLLAYFPYLTFDIPINGLNNMRMSFKKSESFKLYGKSYPIIENTFEEGMIDKEKILNSFLTQFGYQNVLSCPSTVYLVKMDVVGLYEKYNYFIGFKDIEFMDKNLEELVFNSNIYLLYKGTSRTLQSMDSLKDTVYKEWSHRNYFYEGYHEIEFSERKGNQIVINFMVSIKT